MHIAIIGHKHYGTREGGVEVVVTQLARRMAELGHEVVCYDRRGSYMLPRTTATGERIVDSVRVVPVRTIDKRGLAALTSSLFATFEVMRHRPNVVHYHAEGPCVALMLSHWAGIRTVATIHGLDWQRAKWGKLAKAYIRLGKRTAARYADEIIVLSTSAQDHFMERYGRATTFIPNGAEVQDPVTANVITERWGLDTGTYVLFLGRIVPEKGLHRLIEAFRAIDTTKHLVIAGMGSDAPEYESRIHKLAEADDRIELVGFVEGRVLSELYSNAYCYVLPSDIEGMPLSLLEAMSYGCACLTSDIPECSDVLSGTGVTFPRDSVSSLSKALAALLEDPKKAKMLGTAARERVRSLYDWDYVTRRTLSLYRGDA